MWQEIESRIADNEADGKLPSAPFRRAILAELKKTGVSPVHTAKKMASFKLPGGETLLWELTSPALNFFVGKPLSDKLTASGFHVEPRPFDHSRLPNGGRHSALSLDWSFGQEDCVCAKVQDVEDVDRLISALTNGSLIRTESAISREQIEAAMTAFDSYKKTGTHTEIFSAFGEPRDFWVRSSRERENRVYPTKPLIAFILNKRELNGGWGQKADAAARLHNAGFIIVDQNDQPVERPERYEHLMEGADRIRLCALNYFIEPAREKAARDVSIRAGDLASAMGLKDAFPNICQVLGGEKFQKLAQVPSPKSTEPNPSSSTIFTYKLNSQAEADAVTDTTKAPTPSALNLILYGPPGTGKTYRTAWEAVRLCLGEPTASGLKGNGQRSALMSVYRKLVSEGRIEFVTFHQSMSYEEFVEGLRPTTDTAVGGSTDTGFRLEPVAGIFRRISERAEAACDAPIKSPAANEMSANTSSGLLTVGAMPPVRDGTFRQVAQDIATRLAEANPAGFSLQQYREALVQAGQETGVEPTGGWENHNMPNWASHPDQSWLVPADQKDDSLDDEGGDNRMLAMGPESFVLIIDEINRANISKVFGELITLLEPDKRLGMDNEISLTLPYSKKPFGVPRNLHVIGTMNTADRSIALLDTALRRRFAFRELMPDPSVLSNDVEGVDLRRLLSTINERIEYLFDREHQIGHAYFTGCQTQSDIDSAMRDKVIPLLAEYFYEDWSKVAVVLGDSGQGPSRFLDAKQIAAPAGMTEDDFSGDRLRWTVKDRFDFSEFVA